jgi:hypothetical protein
MTQIGLENIYRDIALLSHTERDKLYNWIKQDFYQNSEVIAYTTNGEPLTIEQYRKRVNTGIEQCLNGESVGLEDFSKELGYHYADL